MFQDSSISTTNENLERDNIRKSCEEIKAEIYVDVSKSITKNIEHANVISLKYFAKSNCDTHKSLGLYKNL